MLDLGAALGAQTSVEGVARMLAAAADRLVQCAAVTVWLHDGDTMRLAAARGYTPGESERLAGCELPTGDPLFAGGLERRAVVTRRLPDAAGLTAHLDATPEGSTFVVVAVGERSANRAAIVIQRGPRRGTIRPQERQLLLGIADQSLIALHQPDAVRRARSLVPRDGAGACDRARDQG